MRNPTTTIYLLPRFLGTLLALFLFSFLFEFYQQDLVWNNLLLALLPVLIVFIILIIAWLKEGIGGQLFIILGIIGILYSFATAHDFNWGFLILPGWSILVGFLFLANKHKANN